jgi:hypothetical protein
MNLKEAPTFRDCVVIASREGRGSRVPKLQNAGLLDYGELSFA